MSRAPPPPPAPPSAIQIHTLPNLHHILPLGFSAYYINFDDIEYMGHFFVYIHTLSV